MPARGPRLFHKTLASPSRIALLRHLQTRGAMTVDELADATGLHRNTAREHLHHLIESRLVRSEPVPRHRKGRPTLRYRMASQPDDRERRARALDAKRRAHTRSHTRGQVRATGRSRAQQQLEILGDHMVQCGFDVMIDPARRRMTMLRCPFADMAAKDSAVCRTHEALIHDALTLVPGPVRAGELHRRAGTRPCAIDLTVSGVDTAQREM